MSTRRRRPLRSPPHPQPAALRRCLTGRGSDVSVVVAGPPPPPVVHPPAAATLHAPGGGRGGATAGGSYVRVFELLVRLRQQLGAAALEAEAQPPLSRLRPQQRGRAEAEWQTFLQEFHAVYSGLADELSIESSDETAAPPLAPAPAARSASEVPHRKGKRRQRRRGRPAAAPRSSSSSSGEAPRTRWRPRRRYRRRKLRAGLRGDGGPSARPRTRSPQCFRGAAPEGEATSASSWKAHHRPPQLILQQWRGSAHQVEAAAALPQAEATCGSSRCV
ncbi:uncharacterized protein LOC124803456 [Schistocerca piceifrons]|uniref:uncharacterized protein LOC124803456 n=1 Tax=Schistocerca piceifrons TaxID=274613 RepID=UPI001F5F67C6|nr:uncharacterized protein LOC124803456 [Schistocerca piceifrons]